MNPVFSYLHYGYLATRQGALEDLGVGADGPFRRPADTSTYEDFVSAGVASLRAVVALPTVHASVRAHVHPLSGGLDSRATARLGKKRASGSSGAEPFRISWPARYLE